MMWKTSGSRLQQCSHTTHRFGGLIMNTKERLNHKRELDNKFSVCIVDQNTLI